MNFEEILRNYGDWIRNINLNWQDIRSAISLFGDVCIFFITVYTFRLTIFPKKLKFISFRNIVSSFNGDSVEITLENRSLCPIVLRSVDLIIDSKRIKFFDGYCIIDGFKTETIKMEPFSNIVSDEGEFKIDICSLNKMSLWIETSRGAQHIKYKRNSRILYYFNHKKYMKFKQTMVCRNTYNGKLVMPNIKYVISYSDNNGELQTVFIHNSGLMSEALFGYNGLPKELVENEEELREHFDSEFGKYGISYRLDEVNSWRDKTENEE